ncbi:TIGR03089 family protein [Haloechinothrix sp. YIM 98757]|uniref:TIGR03089 family protein n=1 Tax=Haloechinothrix aidingensis TaxID=2752311 RepID=A0A838AFC1_9PSEU|nr:TIGR03089 family protein [Haloechinothrix aidingensis]
MSITERVLSPLLSSSAARPLVTHYDEDLGSRIELSVTTVANWAAKTANWLTEEFDIEPGDPVCVRLPAHWQTAGVLLGAWWCGGHVVADPQGARVAFAAPGGEDAVAAAEATAVVGLDPMGMGLAEPPAPGAFDYLTEAKLAGDEYTPVLPVGADSPALQSMTTEQVLARAAELAASYGIGKGDRVLSTRDWSLPDGVLSAVLAPLAAGASLVQITGGTADTVAGRRKTEHVTVDIPAPG